MDTKKTLKQTEQKVQAWYQAYTDLNTPVLTSKYALKVQPYAKWVYIVLTIYFAFRLIQAAFTLFSGDISQAIISVVITVAEFGVLRMWCEYLVNVPASFYQKTTSTAHTKPQIVPAQSVQKPSTKKPAKKAKK